MKLTRTAPRSISFTALIFTTVGLLATNTATAAPPFQANTSTCSGCEICVNLHQTSADPFRISGECSETACQPGVPDPYRFADLSSLRGMLQVVTHSIDGPPCPNSLFGTAKWNSTNSSIGADVFFTGPAGQSSVFTRVHFIVSTASTHGGNSTISMEFHGKFQDDWNMNIPNNVTNMEIMSPLTEIGLNFWRSCEAQIQSGIGGLCNGTTCFLLHFPLNTPIFDLPAGYNANSPTLGIVDNIWHGIDFEGDWDAAMGNIGCFGSMHLLHSVTGDLVVASTSVASINLGNVTSTGGTLTVSGNTSAESVDLGALEQVGGSITVEDNSSTGSVDLGALEQAGGSITVEDNGGSSSSLDGTAPLSINFASLTTVDGNLNISANSADTTVNLGPLSLVMGDLKLETKVAGTLDLSAAAVVGNIDVKTKDADALLVLSAGGATTTAVKITRDDSALTAALPANALAAAAVLTAQRIDPSPLPILDALDTASQPIKIDPMAVYVLDANDAPLNQDAAIDLEMTVAEAPSGPAIFLAALDSGRVLLVRRGDGANELYQALELCNAESDAASTDCAVLTKFDQDHVPLPSGSTEAPAFVSLAVATRQLANYAIVIRLCHGDATADGLINIDDLLAVIASWGAQGSNPADITGNGVVDIDDLLGVISSWGNCS